MYVIRKPISGGYLYFTGTPSPCFLLSNAKRYSYRLLAADDYLFALSDVPYFVGEEIDEPWDIVPLEQAIKEYSVAHELKLHASGNKIQDESCT